VNDDESGLDRSPSTAKRSSLNGRDIRKTLEDAHFCARRSRRLRPIMGRSDIHVKIHQLDAELIKLLQFQGDDDCEVDSLSVMVEEEIARRKAVGGRLQ
jgi:hypothetical protein